MADHGSETYFIVGDGKDEGEVGVGGAGRETPESLAATDATGATSAAEGTALPLVLRTAAATPPFRFSRMGPKGVPLSTQNLTKVARAMIEPGGGRSGREGIPAGYTYLGQFVDHDLTFDKTSVMLGEAVTPVALVQGRSPSLDLDSLYGDGPLEDGSRRFYADDGQHLRTGRAVGLEGEGFDLPRGAGRTAAQKRRAIIPDHRNDENLAVAQTHVAMIRFHNRVLDKLPASVPDAARFRAARLRVVKHYQWMVRHDYLPRVCRRAVVDDVFDGGRKVFEVRASGTAVPTMPVEFSIAAFRFGHSMIRSAYDWNANFPGTSGTLSALFDFSATSGSLGGAQRLLGVWVADWRRLYPFGEIDKPDLAPPRGADNLAMRIDTRLVNPLAMLREGSVGGFDDDSGRIQRNLAFRNLQRSADVRLATGPQMVDLMRSRGVAVTPLTRSQILQGDGGADLSALTSGEKDALVNRTPLWFYVLREAEHNRGRLDGVGARIVAETMHRAIEGSTFSILRDADFAPNLGPVAGRFTMMDLLFFAFEGRKRLLNPNG